MDQQFSERSQRSGSWEPDIGEQCGVASNKAYSILGWVNRGSDSMTREVKDSSTLISPSHSCF